MHSRLFKMTHEPGKSRGTEKTTRKATKKKSSFRHQLRTLSDFAFFHRIGDNSGDVTSAPGRRKFDGP